MINFLEDLAGLLPVLGPTQPPVEWVSGVKRPERETDN